MRTAGKANGRLLHRLAPLLAVLPVAGCMTVGPDYQPPAIATPTNWSARAEGGPHHQPA